jgi:hypothetical protein
LSSLVEKRHFIKGLAASANVIAEPGH